MSQAIVTLADWIGRTETREETASALLAERIAALLDHERAPQAGAAWPVAWVWALFPPALRAGEIGPDGHRRRGGFLPPVPLPRRMWAGSTVEVRRPIRVGERLTRRSEILDVADKTGRSGPLVFVTVEHRITGDEGADLSDRHTIVYREITPTPTPTPEPAPEDADAAVDPGFAPLWRRHLSAGPVLLFQYSAVTFNTHRIHYDEPYCRQIEGYPGLVVHGPLIATGLADLVEANQPGRFVQAFTFRALAPVFAPADVTFLGRADGDRFSVAAVSGGRVVMRMDGLTAAR
ncbi:FAS1-like dehydratase domain-containing protein [Prosthecodimorpha staleyi]|uniref:MaoC family dehydratase N-terminal domain-containing protein n=1 Tax=Prosthecodimorpha staleyi TaxID=2840188 RepID=A0A947GF05_9HYPH|nr:MaoC family dehydratase N-terminal domain-containing protein [Prosthecodimorpha staleyi]MBT9290000.1 MaoC family dehydratase N-terminal domain-containing protein [Prosthecodimorpha staleyi]